MSGIEVQTRPIRIRSTRGVNVVLGGRAGSGGTPTEVALSDADPLPLSETPSSGVADQAARADHVHEFPSPSDLGVWDPETLLIGESHLPGSMTRDTEAHGWIDDAVTALKNGAPANGDTLGELHTRLAAVEALGSLATDAELIAAVAALIGSADVDGDTLGELQALINQRLKASLNLSDVPNKATARTNLGLAIGTDVQAYDSDLAAIAALTTTSFGRALLELANRAALLAVLGSGTPSASTILYGNGIWGVPTGLRWLPFGWAAGDVIDLTLQVGAGNSTSNAHGSTSAADGTALYVPFALGEPLTVDALICELTGSSPSTGVVRLGLHHDNSGRPGAVAIDAGTASITSNGLKTLTFSATTLAPGRYHAVLVFQGITGTNPSFRSTASGTQAAARSTPPPSGSLSTNPWGRSADNSVTGALAANPTLSPQAAQNLSLPKIWVRTA